MFTAIDLSELAGLEGPPRTFLTYYLDGETGAGGLARRARAARELVEEDLPDALPGFDASLALLEDLADGKDFSDAAGYCLMACGGLDIQRGYALTVAPGESFRAARGPNLRQLAELQDEYEQFLLVAADNDGTRILQVAGAVAADEDNVKGGVKNKVKKGGWSQQRYARKRKGQLHHYAAEVAEQLAKLVRDRDHDRIVLLGSDETCQQIERELPAGLKEKVIADESFDLHKAEDDLIEEGLRLFQVAEREEERDLWTQIKNEALAGGQGALGAADVLTALQTGRVDELAVDHDAEVPGSRCTACTTLFAEEHTACPLCESDAVPVKLVEECVRLAEQTDAHVEFVQEVAGLKKAGGLAALLRW